MTGFFEESDGVRSMTRLVAFLATLGGILVTAATSAYLLRSHDPQAAVIAAMGGLLLTWVVKGAVAIINRNGKADETEQ